MNTVVTIIGARPQFIKMALVSNALKKIGVKEIIVNTGQHYDNNLSKVFIEELDIPQIKYNLNVGSMSRVDQILTMLKRIEKVLLHEKPRIVLVYGDTNSTISGALTALKHNFQVAHIEAGLRSFNEDMPEEINRVITDNIADYFFCPTKTALRNLKKEGKRKNIYLVGDVMYDSIKAQEIPETNKKITDYILCTVHRSCNTDNAERLKSIFKALSKIKKKIILPLHPRTAKALKMSKIKVGKNIEIRKPVGYLKMLELLKHANLIITDSGGIQKEAAILKVPCVTLRNETEWTETLECGANILAGANTSTILKATKQMYGKKINTNPRKLYGDGYAHTKIASILKRIIKG